MLAAFLAHNMPQKGDTTFERRLEFWEKAVPRYGNRGNRCWGDLQWLR